MYFGRRKLFNYQQDAFLALKQCLAEKAVRALEQDGLSFQSSRLSALSDLCYWYHDRYGQSLLHHTLLALRDSDVPIAVHYLSQLGNECEDVHTDFLINRRFDKQRGELEAVLLVRRNHRRPFDHRYLTVHCFYRNPFNIVQLEQAPLRKRFTIRVYDFGAVGYADLHDYDHDPVKAGEL